MRVKIGNTWHEPKLGEPICLQLTTHDRELINGMFNECDKLAYFDDNELLSSDDKLRWMKDEISLGPKAVSLDRALIVNIEISMTNAAGMIKSMRAQIERLEARAEAYGVIKMLVGMMGRDVMADFGTGISEWDLENTVSWLRESLKAADEPKVEEGVQDTGHHQV